MNTYANKFRIQNAKGKILFEMIGKGTRFYYIALWS
mgnify:FL=1